MVFAVGKIIPHFMAYSVIEICLRLRINDAEPSFIFLIEIVQQISHEFVI